MKTLVWFVLMIGIVAQTMTKTSIYIQFEANRTALAAQHCENRQRPDSTCKGNCYLRKQLKTNDEQHGHKHGYVYKGADLNLFIAEIALQQFKYLKDQVMHCTPYYIGYSFDLKSAVFHPPIFMT